MWICYGISAVAFVVSTLIGQYRGVVGAVCVGAVVTGILMYTKYVSVKFYYDIMADGADEPLLVVRQLVGKREVTLARVALADIIDIKRETAAERKAHKRDKTTNLYVYGPTLAPDVSYRVFISSRYEKSEVILEGSDEFFSKLLEYAAEARSLRTEEEEY